MKALEKLKLSRELNSLIGQVQAGELKGMAKLKTSRRINEIVSLLGSASTTHTAEVKMNIDAADKAFKRIGFAAMSDGLWHKRVKGELMWKIETTYDNQGLMLQSVDGGVAHDELRLDFTGTSKADAGTYKDFAQQIEKYIQNSDFETFGNMDIDLSPFERIVKNNEITLDTLQGAVTSSKLLLNSAAVPPVFIDAVKVVSEQVKSGALLDSLGAQGLELVKQLGNMLLDSTNSPDATIQAAKQIVEMFQQAGWTVTKNGVWSHAEEQFSFRINPNRLYTIDIEMYQGRAFIQSITSNGIHLQSDVDFINQYIQVEANKLDYYAYSNANEYDARISRMQMRRNPEEVIQLPDAIAQAAATSQVNGGEDPSQQQLEANDYKTAKVNIAGMNIAIENPVGSIRKGVDAQGAPWQTQMTAHYGYFEDTLGADGDELDVFIAVDTPHDYDGKVFVMNQIDQRGNFDEHKVLIGAANDHEAAALYRAHYDETFNGIGQIIELTIDQFKDRVFTGKTAFFDSLKPMMLDSWAQDGWYELLPIKRLNLDKLNTKITEAKATVKEPIVVYMVNHKYYVIHGRKRLDIAAEHAEKYVPSIVFDAADNYSVDDIKQAMRKCGSVIHAEALGALIEEATSQRLEKEMAASA